MARAHMTYLVILQEIDSYLIERSGGHVGESSSFSLEVILDGRIIRIDPRRILRVAMRGDLLEELMDEDADINAAMEPYKGPLKGGSMHRRDKRFGYDDKFWDWWHRIGKPQNGGKDIETKKEADEWHDIYVRSKFLIQNSLFEKFIPLLSSKERRSARLSIWIIALLVVRSKNSLETNPLRGSPLF